ncbi:MAG TPA: pilus assembly protein TadG-related protein [Silvibacterium sp.]|nr:pilus assembly protein TadG-related protein [Silvibacterium sp.]
MKSFGEESGQTLVLVAFSMVVLLGFAGFATDVGVMLHERRLVQTAADSAALAGASRVRFGSPAATAAALADASLNGFTNGSNGVTVTVNNPPMHEVENTGFATTAYVEVIIAENTPTYFMKVLGDSTFSVAARAVAGNAAPLNDCVYVLNQTSADAMDLEGSFDVSTPGCGVVVNSNSPSALNLGGKSGTLTAGSVAVVGGATGQLSDSVPAPVTGTAMADDPLAGLAAPEYDDQNVPCSATAPLSGTSTTLAQINANGGTLCYKIDGDITLNNVQLSPGVYVFDNPGHNLQFSGNVKGNDVTLYLLGGLATPTGAALDLTYLDATGAYPGIILFAGRTDSSQLSFSLGNATGVVTGIIYAPDSELFLQDSGSGSGGLSLTTDLIVNTLFDKTATLEIKSFTQTSGSNLSPLMHPVLVE